MASFINWRAFLKFFADARHSTFAPLTIMDGFLRCGQFHLVWVDNLGLLLHVEGVLMESHISLVELVVVVLLVDGEHLLWVGITNKTVGAAECATTGISSRNSLEWIVLVAKEICLRLSLFSFSNRIVAAKLASWLFFGHCDAVCWVEFACGCLDFIA